MDLFSNENVNIKSLRSKAYNYRWATLEDDVIPLTAADPDSPVAKEITQGIADYCADGYFSYGPAEGLPSFKKAISNWYSRRFQVNSKSENILPVNSAAYGLFISAKLILKPNDNAIIPNPVDFLFRKSIENAGAEVRTCVIDKKTAAFNLDDLATKIDSNTRAIFICNPNNPIGSSLSMDHLKAIIELAKKHDLWIVSDEIWADITYDKSTVSIGSSNLPSYEKKLIISGLSKNFGLAGLRIGYVICPNSQIFENLLAVSGHSTTAVGISSLSQAAGTAALTHCDYWLEDFSDHLSRMRQLTLDFIDESPFLEEISPNATYLAFPKITNTKMSSAELTDFLHTQARVAIVPGGKQWFEDQSEGHIRICFSTSQDILTEAFDRIRRVQHEILR